MLDRLREAAAEEVAYAKFFDLVRDEIVHRY
jgi:hypothetical protein